MGEGVVVVTTGMRPYEQEEGEKRKRCALEAEIGHDCDLAHHM